MIVFVILVDQDRFETRQAWSQRAATPQLYLATTTYERVPILSPDRESEYVVAVSQHSHGFDLGAQLANR